MGETFRLVKCLVLVLVVVVVYIVCSLFFMQERRNNFGFTKLFNLNSVGQTSRICQNVRAIIFFFFKLSLLLL